MVADVYLVTVFNSKMRRTFVPAGGGAQEEGRGGGQVRQRRGDGRGQGEGARARFCADFTMLKCYLVTAFHIKIRPKYAPCPSKKGRDGGQGGDRGGHRRRHGRHAEQEEAAHRRDLQVRLFHSFPMPVFYSGKRLPSSQLA